MEKKIIFLLMAIFLIATLVVAQDVELVGLKLDYKKEVLGSDVETNTFLEVTSRRQLLQMRCSRVLDFIDTSGVAGIGVNIGVGKDNGQHLFSIGASYNLRWNFIFLRFRVGYNFLHILESGEPEVFNIDLGFNILTLYAEKWRDLQIGAKIQSPPLWKFVYLEGKYYKNYECRDYVFHNYNIAILNIVFAWQKK